MVDPKMKFTMKTVSRPLHGPSARSVLGKTWCSFCVCGGREGGVGGGHFISKGFSMEILSRF